MEPQFLRAHAAITRALDAELVCVSVQRARGRGRWQAEDRALAVVRMRETSNRP